MAFQVDPHEKGLGGYPPGYDIETCGGILTWEKIGEVFDAMVAQVKLADIIGIRGMTKCY